jgi:copper ion binding protein
MSTTRYHVRGMTCGHCVAAVSDEIGQLPGVRDVRVDLASGEVTVTSDTALDDSAIATAVSEAGYEVARAS